MSTAIVIGGGIGGLTAGLALTARGWDVTVIERAPELLPVGYALLLAPNALRALDTLPGGIVAELAALSAMQGDGGLRASNGRWLSRNDATIALARYGYPAVVVRRAALIEMLASRLPAGALRLGTTVIGLDAEAGAVTLESGEVLRADLVVAADGIRSALRSRLFPGHPAPAFLGLTTWQAVVSGDGIDAHVGNTWGRGGEIGTMPLADGSLYVFAEHAAKNPLALRSGDEEKAELRRLYGGFHDPIPELISRIDPDHLLRADVYALPAPLPTLHRGRVAILGDAAHPMAPNLGQGACQAIEDAVTLGYCVGPGDGPHGVTAALVAYSTARLPRTSLMVSRSLQIARVATTGNPFAVGLRNLLLRATGLLGASAALRQADFLMRWDHPAVEEPAHAVRGSG